MMKVENKLAKRSGVVNPAIRRRVSDVIEAAVCKLAITKPVSSLWASTYIQLN